MRSWLKSLPATSSLGFRLSLTLVIALMPLGILSMVQTKVAQNQLNQATLEGVGAAAMMAVEPQVDLIRQAQTTASVVARALAASIPPEADCIALMRSVNAGIPQATLVAYIPLSGQMRCSSVGKPFDFSRNKVFARLSAKPEPILVYNPKSPVSGIPIIGASHPVFNANGTQVGIVGVSIPHRLLTPQIYEKDYVVWRPSVIVAFTGDGTVLAASAPQDTLASLLPPGMKLRDMPSRVDQSAFEEGPDGQHGIVSVTKIAPDLFLLSTWQRDLPAWEDAKPYLLPALTWAAALIAAAWSSSHLMVRHIRSLSLAMTAYSTSRMRSPLSGIAEAPAEIRTLHSVYEEMIRTIERDEAELENLLVDKETLLKEVHHRSGNSLQIIASTMRIYRRETTDPALRNVLDGLINRVIALASTHISLFNQSGRRDVPMDEILAAVIRRLKEIHGIAIGTARKQLAPVRMPSQTAIPLALALAEVVSCHFAAKIGPDSGIDVTLSEADNIVSLTIAGPELAEFRPQPASQMASLPRRMLTQFAAQLHGELSVHCDGGRSVVKLTIPRAVG